MNSKMPEEVEILAVETPHLDEFSENLSPELEKQFDRIAEEVRTEIEK